MPLDPVLKAFLDQVAAAGGPKTWEMQPGEAREAFAGLLQLAGPKDIPIGKVVNIAIPAEHGEIANGAVARDPAFACARLREHIRRTGTNLHHRLAPELAASNHR